MITKTVRVTFDINVTIDETKFDDIFMEEFRDTFYKFWEIDEHIEHLAQLYARCGDMNFIEGYGSPNEMKISFKTVGIEAEIVD